MVTVYHYAMPAEEGTLFWCPSEPNLHRHATTIVSMTCMHCNMEVTADLDANAYRTRQYIIRELAEPW